MDAVKFIKERNRMCTANKGSCAGCPANGDNCFVSLKSFLYAGEQVKIVEEWSAAHPRKIRQDVFLEQWPNAPILHDGFLGIKPCSLDEEKGKKCGAIGCMHCRREFWRKVVE